MLRYDLAELIRTPGMQEVLAVHEPPYEAEDVDFVSPIDGKVTVTNTGSMLLVRGVLKTVIAEHCSRCLTDVRVPIQLELEESFDLKVIQDAEPLAHAVQIVEEDEAEPLFDGKLLLLDVLVRQAALVAAPLQPLCKEDCPGIAVISNLGEDAEALERSPFRELSKLLSGDQDTDSLSKQNN